MNINLNDDGVDEFTVAHRTLPPTPRQRNAILRAAALTIAGFIAFVVGAVITAGKLDIVVMPFSCNRSWLLLSAHRHCKTAAR
jgi:hypothetical protein